MTLWSSTSTSVHDQLLRLTVGNDCELDLELLGHDCVASAAHGKMLHDIGVLNGEEWSSLLSALKEAKALADKRELKIELEQEDGHTALEQFLVERAGDVGKKIHTGRSRNDQVIAATRLWMRHESLARFDSLLELAEVLSQRGEASEKQAMPGYTHTRQGMPSTVGQWFFAYAEDALFDAEHFAPLFEHLQRSALGSASGYGVPMFLDRERVAGYLGLSGVSQNTIHVQNTRGKLESIYCFVLHQIAMTLGRFATDMVWFTSEAFEFFELPKNLTTGSSIMPQKRNPDLMELTRASVASFLAYYTEASGVLQGIGAGYHRDLQRCKEPALRANTLSATILLASRLAAEHATVNTKALDRALRAEIFATDRAYQEVHRGTSFRDAYRKVKEEPNVVIEKEEWLSQRTSLGHPGVPQRESLQTRLKNIQSISDDVRAGLTKAEALLHC